LQKKVKKMAPNIKKKNSLALKNKFTQLVFWTVCLLVQSSVFGQNWNFYYRSDQMSLLASSLASGNVSLSTSSSAANGGIEPVYGRGDIVFLGTLTYSNANARTLTLTSDEDIWINGDITSTGGQLNLAFNVPAGKKILINGDITTNGGSITVNNGSNVVSSVHFQKTTGSPVIQTINTNGGAISFNNSTLKLLNTGGSLVLNSGAGAITLGGSGSILQEGTFYQCSPTFLLGWGGAHTNGEKSYTGFTITNGKSYSGRIYFWDSWDNERGEVAVVENGSWKYYFTSHRTYSASGNGFSSTVANYNTQHQLSSQGNLGGNINWVDAYADFSFTAQHTGTLKTFSTTTSAIDDESLELYNVWETSFTTAPHNNGVRTLEFITTNTTQDACLISGVISGGLILKKSGTGTVKLSNYNTYTGGTTVDAGILQLHDSGISGNAGKGTINGELTINQNGTVQLSGNPAALGWWSTPYYANNRVTTLNINGGLLEAVGGQQHIWNMTGGVNFSEGGTIRSNGGTSSAAATSYIEWGGSNITVSNTNTNRPAVISGRVHLRNDYGEMTYTVNNNSQEYDLIFSAAITEASTTNLIKAGTGKLVFTGNNSARTGTTTVSAGTLVVGASNALGSGAVNLEAGTTLLTGRGITTLANNMVLNGNATLGLDKSVEVLLVGGGGGGASGGGGAGGVVSQSMSLNSGTYTVTVGAGGTGTDADQSNGNNGGQTTFIGVNAFGGGGGGKTLTGGLSGASGGGTGSDATTAGGTATQGYAGGVGISTAPCSGASGGGGAGAAGSSGWTQTTYNNYYGLSGQNTMGGNAGIGVLNAITGSATYYGGGGGGGCNNNAGTQPQERAGQGGLGGGGRGANANNGNGIAGTANTGGGGGGGDWEGFGANGGSGVVILRYAGATNGTGGTITNGTGSATGFTIHTFNASGSFTLNSSTSLEVTGVVSGTGGLTYEANDGAITLSAANTYSGSTVISSGTLVLNTNASIGSASNTSTFTNNGIFTLKNGATFIPSPVNNSISGSGTYNVEKSLTGNSSTWTNTSGRFWYMGVPMKNVARNNYGTPGTTTNRVWSYAESTKSYSEVTDGSVLLSAGTGYVYRRSTDGTLTFTASGTNGLRDTDFTASGLTKTTGHSAGYHLISNPFMAYVDWHAVHTGATNMESTYYIRSNNSTNTNISALISYNKSTALATNNSSITATPEQLRYIAPMQSIWVRVSGAAGSTGSLSMSRSMLSHQSGNVGLKSSTVFPNLARVNLVDGNNFDQLLVYLNGDMSNEVDEYDSEKMPVAGTVQVYTMSSNKKLVMNGLKNNKKKVSVPLYLELPETKSYTLQLSEYQVEDGLILLEDKQEGTIQDFTLMENYSFYANSGLLQNRFVLHFILPDAELAPQGPSNSWVAAAEGSYTEGGDVEISNDDKGNIEITLNQAAEQKVEGTVQASDVNGKIVYSGILEGALTTVELNVPAGIYYLTVQSGTLIEKKKVFIQE
jgi:autotransporter-associated beta strand protein